MSRKPRRVLLVIGALDLGGTETQLLRTIPLLTSAERAFTVFTLSRRGALADAFEASGVPVIGPWLPTKTGGSGLAMRALRTTASALQLLAHLLAKRPDIVHCVLPHGYWLGGTLAWLTRVRVRMMSRRSLNNYLKTRPQFFAWLERRLHRRMSVIIGNSRAIIHQLVHEEGAPPDRAMLIYNGIDVAACAPGDGAAHVRRDLGVPDTAIVLCIVANLIPYKGHIDLLEACARLDHRAPWHLLVVGEDMFGNAAALRALASRLGIERRVSFLGRRSDVFDLLAASDIGVLASHEEGLPNAILEYMAAGLAVVATSVGGVSEIVVAEETGLLAAPRDPSSLAAALQRVIADPALRERLAAAGRARVGDVFTIERSLEQYASLYDRL